MTALLQSRYVHLDWTSAFTGSIAEFDASGQNTGHVQVLLQYK